MDDLVSLLKLSKDAALPDDVALLVIRRARKHVIRSYSCMPSTMALMSCALPVKLFAPDVRDPRQFPGKDVHRWRHQRHPDRPQPMDYIDSTALGLIAKTAVFPTHNGRKPIIVSTNPDITRVLESMGFDRVFLILDCCRDEGCAQRAAGGRTLRTGNDDQSYRCAPRADEPERQESGDVSVVWWMRWRWAGAGARTSLIEGRMRAHPAFKNPDY